MKAARLYAPKDLRIEEIADPRRPGPGEVLVSVRCVGVCGSDVHYYRDGRIGTQVVEKPIILGHEAAGVIEEVGPGVSGISRGDHVAMDPGLNCGHCEQCLQGNPNLCPSIRFFGTPPVDGVYCEKVIHPAGAVFVMPRNMTFAEGAMLEPLGVGIYSVELADVRPGYDVAVLGCGPIGLLALAMARASGADRIFATDLLPYRLEHARRLGADEVLQAGKDDVVGAVMKATRGRGVDVVLEAAGVAETFGESVSVARSGGTVVYIGIPASDRYEFAASPSRHKGLTIKICRRMKYTYPRAIRLVSNRRVNAGSLVTHRFGLESIVDALKLVDAYGDGVVKAVIEIGEGR